MKKNPTEEELRKLYEENIGALAYELEDAFLEVFSRKSETFQKPAFFLGAIAVAAGHVMQVTEKQLGYEYSFKESFDDVMMQTYNHYRQHPSDEEDNEDLKNPKIDLSKFS
jgi:hypothetical protein